MMDSSGNAVVDLRAAARWEGFGIAVAGLAALVVGPFITVLGSVFLVGLVLGPLLILAGIVGLVWGAWGLLFPLSHGAIRALGNTAAEREQTLRQIEGELATQVLAGRKLASGAVVSVTPHFFVVHGKGLLLARREDLLWGYGKVTTHKSYGITTGKTNDICLVTRQRKLSVSAAGPEDAAAALSLFSFASPRALVGYRDDIAALSQDALAARIGSVPFAGDEPPAMGVAAQAPAAPLAPRPPSSALPWISVVSGAAIAGLGALTAAFFAWVALHPSGPDDQEFGAIFSLTCFFACCAPGLLAFALGSWRLYARYR